MRRLTEVSLSATNVQDDTSTDGVLLVSPWFKESLGGVATVADRLFRLLTEAGVRVSLLVTHEKTASKPRNSDFVLPSVVYEGIPSNAFHSLGFRSVVSNAIRGAVAFWRISRILKAHRVRTLVVIFPTDSSWLFKLLRPIFGLRLIVSCHGNDISKFRTLSAPGRWAVRGLLKSADVIVVCAEHLADQLQAILPDRRLPIVVIPNCVDADHFTLPPPEIARRKNPRTLIHVSNFAPKKRTRDIIEAFAMARLPEDSRLIMVGDGQDLDAAKEVASKHYLGNRVEFVGRQSDVRPFLWRSDLFILASDDEGAPLVILEAMACGLAWISTPWGVAATLPRGECGLLVSPGAPLELAAAMEELINDPVRCEKMGLRGRQRVEREFTSRKYLNAHLELLQQLRTARMSLRAGTHM